MRKRKFNESIVSITKNEDESTAIREGFELLNVTDSINQEDVVVITANWVAPNEPKTADVVGDVSLGTIIQYIKNSNPKRIVVAAGSGNGDTRGIMKLVGYDKIIDREEIDFIDLNEEPFEVFKLDNDKPRSTGLNNLVNEMTFHISFTQLKIHEEATMSASIKNMALSWAPTAEHGVPKKDTGIHNTLHQFIYAMAKTIPVDLSIVSANPAMIATGPHKGIAKHTGLVIMGTDPISTDTVCARLIGFKPQAVNYLYKCSNDNIGIFDTDRFEIRGMPLTEAESHFSNICYGESITVD